MYVRLRRTVYVVVIGWNTYDSILSCQLQLELEILANGEKESN